MNRHFLASSVLALTAVTFAASSSSAQHTIYPGGHAMSHGHIHGDHHHGHSAYGYSHGGYMHGHHSHAHAPYYQVEPQMHPIYAPTELYAVPIYIGPGSAVPLISEGPFAPGTLRPAIPGHASGSVDHSPGDADLRGYVEQPTLPPHPPSSQPASEGERYRGQAEQAFRAGDFDNAVRLANHALVETPQDGDLLLFFAQTLFAIGDYRAASAVIHDAASLLDPTRLRVVAETYNQYPEYDDQMDQLDQFIAANPGAAFAHFVRGYQLGFRGDADGALRDLRHAVALSQSDPLASQLIQRFSGPPPATGEAPIQMDGPPPTIEAARDASDGHQGHDHSHAGHSHP